MNKSPLVKYADTLAGSALNITGTLGDAVGETASGLAQMYGAAPLPVQIGIPAALAGTGLGIGALKLIKKNRRLKDALRQQSDFHRSEIDRLNKEKAGLLNMKAVSERPTVIIPENIAAEKAPAAAGILDRLKKRPVRSLGLAALLAGAGYGAYRAHNKENDTNAFIPGIPTGNNRLMATLGGASLGATGGYLAGQKNDPQNANMYALGGGLAGGIGGYTFEPAIEKYLNSMPKTSTAKNFIMSALEKKALFDDPIGSLLGLATGGLAGYGAGKLISHNLADTPENSDLKKMVPSLATILGGFGGAAGVDYLVKKMYEQRSEVEQPVFTRNTAMQTMGGGIPTQSQQFSLSPAVASLLAQQYSR